ncbi:MAG: YifB family Mg chelatase-like AAA ATPase [Anaerolineae bacterium]|nr:YifB family Mg chelatase-like AAA ATPase [Myxococcota bacterium]MDW8317149.1 YifB family Mg chelatase-like AAA ATPase [Anaerolineae bacterium]
MLAKVLSCSVVGLEGTAVEVEVDIYTNSLPSITLVGLPDAAVKESTERVRAALVNSGLLYPRGRVTVNLAPADLRKVGPVYDLPIAVGLLAASGQVPADRLERSLFIGELSLDGTLRHIDGVLPMAHMAQQQGVETVYLPEVDAPEAALVQGIDVIPVPSLSALVTHLRDFDRIPPYVHDRTLQEVDDVAYTVDFADIKGQEHVKRALEVAAAGAHNVLMTGPPGAGKTLMARSLPSILPKLTLEEALDITRIYSVAGQLPPDQPLITHRPFRAPHHTISHAGLVGGGRLPQPGEISLAHRGVLFLDELPEFGPHNLETLRQPLEDRTVTISRAQGSLTFPANFMLVGAMNPCPCGWHGDPQHECTCSPAVVSRYQKRLSGPLLDRIDIHVEVPRVDFEKLSDSRRGEPSRAIRQRVEAARQRQRRRFAPLNNPRLMTNADMGPAEIREFCPVDDAGHSLLRAAMRQLQMSARAYHRTLKLARTIADLAGSERIETVHLAEAIQYRPRWQV